jgi:putative ABC transport system permease protein
MLILEVIRVALQSIRANLFRALLTMLGIIIGVAAVITMVALGTGARQAIDEQIANLGSNILQVSSRQGMHRGVSIDQLKLSVDDAKALERDGAYIQAVVPEIPVRLQVKRGNINLNVQVVGTTPNYADVHAFQLLAGQMFTAADDAARRRVVVLGGELPEMLETPADQLIGETILIRAIPFTVIGVFQEKGSPGMGNPDDDIWIPLNTAQYRVAGTDMLQTISVQIADGVPIERAMVDIERVMRREHRILPGKDNDFSIFDRTAFLNTRQEATQIFSFLLAGIAGVSLVVGGIGIMNIMLVTVTERTREIGVRMALGATRFNILLQFLVESMTLCLLGGLVGVGLGTGLAVGLARFAGWQTVVSTEAIGLAFLFSAAVGLFFGLLPARRAARLDPIEALRYE